MAFAVRNLSVLAYANGFTLWHYKAGQDGLSVVGAPDYFSDATDMLSPGDMMMISAPGAAQLFAVGRTQAGGPVLLPLG